MINRVLIRLKIIQIVYAYYQNGSKNLDSAEKELFFSLSKAYDLYNYLLMLMMALTEYAQKRIDAAKAKLAPTKEELYPNTKFVDNKFVAQLEVNKQLTEFISNQKRTWANDQDFVKELYEKIVESDIYKDYMASGDNSYEADRELWRKLYKTYIFNNDSLDQVLEDQSLYWNDDKEIEQYLSDLLNKKAFDKSGLIYGMGHAVYSLSDPRANVFKSFVESLSKEKGREDEFNLYSRVERLAPQVIASERKMYKGVSANVDFYSGFVYSMLDLPMELYTPMFAIARIAGWSAHRIEELVNPGKIIRPAYKSIAPHKEYVPLDSRD